MTLAATPVALPSVREKTQLLSCGVCSFLPHAGSPPRLFCSWSMLQV